MNSNSKKYKDIKKNFIHLGFICTEQLKCQRKFTIIGTWIAILIKKICIIF